MLVVFDLSRWWKMNHNDEQLAMFNDIIFNPILGYPSLFVSDVTSEQITMLVLLGLRVDNSVATDFNTMGYRTKILYKSDDKYSIVSIQSQTQKFGDEL